MSGLEETDLRQHILGGFRSRIQFRVRVYRENSGILPLLGDDMLFEAHPEQTGRWDPFSSSYELRFHDGSRRYFSGWEAFYRDFTELRNFPVPEFGSSGIYILVQARFQKMVFNPPLNILSVFLNRYAVASPWFRLDRE